LEIKNLKRCVVVALCETNLSGQQISKIMPKKLKKPTLATKKVEKSKKIEPDH